MQRKNLFDGDSYKAQFALITYRWLMSHRWVSYADIMADYIGVTTKDFLLICQIAMGMAS